MIISVTERGTFKRCRRQWDYASFNRQSLTPIVSSPALELGTLIHDAFSAWLVDWDKDPVDLFTLAAQASIKHIEREYAQRVGIAPSLAELAPVLDSIEIGRAMLSNYQKRWKTPLPEGFTLVAPEQKIEVPIPNTEHFLEARIDAFIRDRKGMFYILEHKTYGNTPRLDTLNMNDQFLAYTWVLRKALPQMLNTHANMSDQVGGVAYDGMWKRAEPPKGKTFSDLFLRAILKRTKHELDEFEEQLTQEANDMANNPAIYMNRRWEGCHDCNFYKLCIATSKGEDSDYIKANYFKQRIPHENLLEVAL